MARKSRKLVAGIFRLVKMSLTAHGQEVELHLQPAEHELVPHDPLAEMRFAAHSGPCILLVDKDIADQLHLKEGYEVQLRRHGGALKVIKKLPSKGPKGEHL